MLVNDEITVLAQFNQWKTRFREHVLPQARQQVAACGNGPMHLPACPELADIWAGVIHLRLGQQVYHNGEPLDEHGLLQMSKEWFSSRWKVFPDTEERSLTEEEQQRGQDLETAVGIWAQSGDMTKWIGVLVEKGFPQINDLELGREYLWIEITGVNGNRLVGRLLDQPRLATHLELGDEIEVEEDEINRARRPVSGCPC